VVLLAATFIVTISSPTAFSRFKGEIGSKIAETRLRKDGMRALGRTWRRVLQRLGRT
jgi:hypothetical protein